VPTLHWRGGAVQWAEWTVSLGERGLSSRIVVVRFDPRAVRLSLDLIKEGSATGAWTLDRAPTDAVLALNAGQFTDAGPWGWVVHRGREWQAPGAGALAGALVIDSAGVATLVDASDLPTVRARGLAVEAMQSYPTLLVAGSVAPAMICDAGTADSLLDRSHRDARLAIGIDRAGRVLIAMSRFAGAGRLAERLPIGPTTPEMAEIMRRLGAERALMLDGGLSAQMMVRMRPSATATQWPGLRGVPLALVGRPAAP
jgi:exopolysaccharide biosynthesis protein